MNAKIQVVLAGYVALTASERNELKREIIALDELALTKKSLREDSVRDARNHVEFGPLGVSCPCCGR